MTSTTPVHPGLSMGQHALKSAVIASTLVLAATGSASAADNGNNSFNNFLNNSLNTNITTNLSNFGNNSTNAANSFSFEIVVSQGARSCLPDAKAQVRIVSTGTAEDMFIFATGLPPNTDFDFFVIQVPNAPFGLSWYQGDLETDDKGDAFQHFRGRFSIETFIVAPGVAPAPLVFNAPPFPDAAQNPSTGPIQTYHLGLWFNSPTDAKNAGCPGTVTPFNGEHNAGIQVLNTSNFPDNAGPLRNLNP